MSNIISRRQRFSAAHNEAPEVRWSQQFVTGKVGPRPGLAHPADEARRSSKATSHETRLLVTVGLLALLGLATLII